MCPWLRSSCGQGLLAIAFSSGTEIALQLAAEEIQQPRLLAATLLSRGVSA
jgi:hypothetical protein